MCVCARVCVRECVCVLQSILLVPFHPLKQQPDHLDLPEAQLRAEDRQNVRLSVCVPVCGCERERESERVHVCVSACGCERVCVCATEHAGGSVTSAQAAT